MTNRQHGHEQRARIRALLPALRVGLALPSGGWLGWKLGVDQSSARRHLHRMLDEAGIATETRGKGRAQRVYIVAISNNQMGEAA